MFEEIKIPYDLIWRREFYFQGMKYKIFMIELMQKKNWSQKNERIRNM